MGTRTRQNTGYIVGIILTFIILAALFNPGYADWHVHGPMNTGHENMPCENCHIDSPGTLRQQLQANMRFLLGNRADSLAVGYRPVSNQECIHCHERPNDRHPVYRFIEPRFKKARDSLSPHQCNACHTEHNGKRVTTSIEICETCHEDIKLKNDPVDTNHQSLAKSNQWQTCLGCHDFHGNHKHKASNKMSNRISAERLAEYFNGSISPYSKEKHYRAKNWNRD